MMRTADIQTTTCCLARGLGCLPARALLLQTPLPAARPPPHAVLAASGFACLRPICQFSCFHQVIMSIVALHSQATAAGARWQQSDASPAPLVSARRPTHTPSRPCEAIQSPRGFRSGTLQRSPPAPGTAAAAKRTAAGAAGTQQQQRPGDEFFARDQRPIILFDGVCNL